MSSLRGRLKGRTCAAKIQFHCQLADLTIERGFLTLRLVERSIPAAGREGYLRAVEQRLLPRINLVRMDPVARSQLSNRAVALDRRQRHLRFECRRMLPSYRVHLLLPSFPF
jgi:hypothetical protein